MIIVNMLALGPVDTLEYVLAQTFSEKPQTRQPSRDRRLTIR